ncbi:MAG: sigma-70 family RNA polymerase sigma factor [Clostridia bacterium]|nr:sigma-70 family RNA polymerase sigma factor [Clostridia bacterium]
MADFVAHWADCRGAVERYVHLRISNREDAQDVISEVLTAAYRGYDTLQDPAQFRPWIIGIARNKCADALRRKYAHPEITMEAVPERAVHPRFAMAENSAVALAMEAIPPDDQQLLHMFYWQELPQAEIARRLEIPTGTVKSRLHHARERFRACYPQRRIPKGDTNMTKMPLMLPDYTITPVSQPPFPVKWEEMMGWFIVPKVGEKLSWAMYDFPERVRTEVDDMEVVGRAMVHGIEGVEVHCKTRNPMDCNQTEGDSDVERSFIAQLTDTHCRILAETHMQDGVKRTYTFLDGDTFLNNWGFGEDNCGNETNLRAKGEILRQGSAMTTTTDTPYPMDVVGRYTIEINGKTYDTVCVIMHETYMGGMLSEQFIDRNGRTVLWRRFNADDWHFEHYGRTWSQMLPDSETLTVNGQTYVHWYDCITSYIL